MLPKPLWMLAKVWHCPRDLVWRKCCINRHKVTYFCEVNQFRELSEDTCSGNATIL
jgi:hypothetical protein